MWNRLAVTLGLATLLLACATGDAPDPTLDAVDAPPPLQLGVSCDQGLGGSSREWNCTGDALNDVGRVAEARRAYGAALESFDRDSKQHAYALGGIAVTSAKLGECPEAESALRELRQISPTSPLARLREPVCTALRGL